MQKLRTSPAHASQIGERVDPAFEIVHDVAGVVVDFDAGIIDLARDRGAGCAGAGFAAVLLDDEDDAVVWRAMGPSCLKRSIQTLAIAAAGVAKGEHLRARLPRPLAGCDYAKLSRAFVGFRIDGGEHHDRFESQIAAAAGPNHVARAGVASAASTGTVAPPSSRCVVPQAT